MCFFSPPDVEGCRVTIMQEEYKESFSRETITLLCQVTTDGCNSNSSTNGPAISWFRYLALKPENLVNLPLNGDKNLKMKNVSVQDSGIYVCGVTYKDQEPTSQNIGRGTTLMIIGKDFPSVTIDL